MTGNALHTFVERTRSTWGPLSTELVARTRGALEELAKTPATEPWLDELHREAPASRELYRDADHGFVLLAHTENEGLYRAPHDHGRGWVLYALERGEIAMTTYARVETEEGPQLVKRDERVMRPGEARVFLPGDIHDTRCVSGPALLFRFTDRDLKIEDAERRLQRYVERAGRWTLPR